MRVQLSPKLWTLEVKLPLGPDINKFRETGYPESGPVRISSVQTKPTRSSVLLAELDVGLKLVDLGGESTNRLDMVSQRSPDRADILSPYAPNE